MTLWYYNLCVWLLMLHNPLQAKGRAFYENARSHGTLKMLLSLLHDFFVKHFKEVLNLLLLLRTHVLNKPLQWNPINLWFHSLESQQKYISPVSSITNETYLQRKCEKIGQIVDVRLNEMEKKWMGARNPTLPTSRQLQRVSFKSSVYLLSPVW